jgi:lipoprotein-releasing system ATP-binding protein
MKDRCPLLAARDLHKTYRKNADQVRVLRGLDLEVAAGEFACVVGASGSGKSTMLHLFGTLDRPDQGEIHLEGERIDNLPSERRDRLRNQTFGFIFQFYHLLPELNTLENVLVPHMIAHSLWSWVGQRRALRRRGEELLDRVGLSHRLRHRPRELSGGEMQRAAIARALVNRPRILLADEPTGNLDRRGGDEIFALLRQQQEKRDCTLVVVTHDRRFIRPNDQVLEIEDGLISP